MTADELLARESIRHTLARYTLAGDRLQAEKFAAVFTADGILETDGVPAGDSFRYQGRDQIFQWLDRWRQPAAESAVKVHQATFVRHHLATCLIEFNEGGLAADNEAGGVSAKARTYWTAYTDIGPDHSGYYVDRLHKVGSEWLIAHRKIRLDWRSANSLMFTAITRTR